MVTQAQIHDHIARRPFKGFRLVLKTGVKIDVARQLMAVAMPRQVVVGINNHFRDIPLESIDRVELLDAPNTTGEPR